MCKNLLEKINYRIVSWFPCSIYAYYCWHEHLLLAVTRRTKGVKTQKDVGVERRERGIKIFTFPRIYHVVVLCMHGQR